MQLFLAVALVLACGREAVEALTVPTKLATTTTKYSMRGAYSGKDCPTVFIVDSAYVRGLKQASSDAAMQLARANVGAIMERVTAVFTAALDVRFPVVDVRWANGSNDAGVGIDDATTTASAMLDKMSRAVVKGDQDRNSAFFGLRKMCHVHLLTDRNFPGNMLGLSFRATDSSQALCSQSGFNVALTTVSLRGKPKDFATVEEATLHEFAHSAGAPHDDDLVKLGQATAFLGNMDDCSARFGFVMEAIIDPGSNQDTFSRCSVAMVDRQLTRHADCLVARAA